ncbi:phosphotransferase enzyme family protein [Sphingobacterium pedocola]|uniref:Desulfatase n=1 Tax=Sphingobacterium pedocola TaxID=2082722 RepID=A0ABR9T562_9SPHI|nr:aminoglycoside phosphotransferase family protein [Sphingobacterium pedocola]MBE8720482.1 desulfatase [Sphingobacterium pedocola]
MSIYDFNKIIEIAKQFDLTSIITDAERFGSGHINDTFKLSTGNPGDRSYLLQRVNHDIFKDIPSLMNNIYLVTNHLKNQFKIKGISDVDKYTLTIIPTKDNKLYHRDDEGSCWRLFILLSDTKSYDIVETTKQAYSGGQAFGQFQKQLADLDATQLVEILPNFHNIDFRIKNLKDAVSSNKADRIGEIPDLLDYVFERELKMRRILDLAATGDLPLRITHNDTKFNNVLLDQNDNVQCVIDLDTVMPGYIAYDFGDAIRTIINSAAEDEIDIDKIVLNIPLFKAYSEGYLSEAKEFLTDKEIESLMYGVLLLPYMQAVRFLTDYIDGDAYYKVHYPNHNLVRAKAQFKLVDELEKHEEELRNILELSLVAQ